MGERIRNEKFIMARAVAGQETLPGPVRKQAGHSSHLALMQRFSVRTSQNLMGKTAPCVMSRS